MKRPGKIGAVIVARMTSSRFPGKTLADICGKPSLLRLIERVKRSAYVGNAIIIATTTDEADRPIAAAARRASVRCYRGSREDVLGRVLGAAREAGFESAVHVTGDCPLIDPEIIDEVVSLYLRTGADYAKNFPWGAQAGPSTGFPNGLDVEVFRTSALAAVDKKARDPWIRQHVTEPLYTWPEFKAVTLPARGVLARPEIRICVDTPEDLQVVSKIYGHFLKDKKDFRAADIIAFLDRNPALKKINAAVSQRKYRAAVIGLGNIGSLYDQDRKMSGINTHSGAYMRWSKTRLVAGCDPDQGKRKAFQRAWGVSDVFSDTREMLCHARPEIVSICTPLATHARIVRDCVRHGVKAILCEKPFVTSAAEGEKLIELCDKNKVVLAVNHWMRYADLYQGLKASLGKGIIGRVYLVRYHYSKGLYNSGSHAIDLLRYLLGNVKKAVATGSHRIDTGDANVDGYLEFDSGAAAFLTTGDYRCHFTTEIDLMGEKGRIRIADNDRIVEFYRSGPSRDESGVCELIRQKVVPFPTGRGAFMVNAVSNLVDALEGKAKVFCCGDDAVQAVRTIEALAASLRRRS